MNLFMVKLGARPKGRLIEQHDIFFGVATKLVDLIDPINNHWSEVKNQWHIDAFRRVTKVVGFDGQYYRITWLADDQLTKDSHLPKPKAADSKTDESNTEDLKLYFINLGGYIVDEFEEYHHKMLVVAPNQAKAVKQAKLSDFYQRYGFNDPEAVFNAAAHVDDKMQVVADAIVDECHDVNHLLQTSHKTKKGRLIITPITKATDAKATEPMADVADDKQYIGYLSLNKLKRLGI